MPHEAIGYAPDRPMLSQSRPGDTIGEMTDLQVHIPDEVAQRLATEAAQRGTSTEDVAAEALSRYAPTPQGRSLDFIGMFDAPVGFYAQRAGELLETEGFVASS